MSTQQDKQAWQNAEVQVLSDDEINNIVAKMDTGQPVPASHVVASIETVPADTLHVKHINGLIELTSIALVIVLVYAIYEMRSIIKIGKLIEKELGKK